MNKTRRFFMTSLFPKAVLLAMAVLFFDAGFGQETTERPMPRRESSGISFEALPFFSDDTTLGVVNIHYRIREDFFVVLRNIESLRSNDFIARGDLLVELHNESGLSVARGFRSVVLRKESIASPEDKVADIQGSMSFRVTPGTYTVFFNLEDRQSERSFTNKTQKVTTRPPLEDAFDVSSPIFVSRSSFMPNDSLSFTAMNRGTDVLFGERGGLLFAVRLPNDQTTISVQASVTHEPEFRIAEQNFTERTFVMMNGLPTLQSSTVDTVTLSSEPIRYSVMPQGDWKTLFVPLPIEGLYPGRARLNLRFESGSQVKTSELTFKVLWPDRPMALGDLDLAVDALRHIASAEEMDAFQTFPESRYVQKFFEFWRKKDPDTTTAYNELMVEYYRRVDVANRQYSTKSELDGYKSDRGRIYILYGSPTHTQRLFSPGGPPKEVWTYTNLKRRFIFEDLRRNGIYTLVSVDNL